MCNPHDRGITHFRNDELLSFSKQLFPDIEKDWRIAMIAHSQMYVMGTFTEMVSSIVSSCEGKLTYQRIYPDHSSVEVLVDPLQPIENDMGVCAGNGIQAVITDAAEQTRTASLLIVRSKMGGKDVKPVIAKESYAKYQAIVVFREPLRDPKTAVLRDGFVVVEPTQKT